MSHNSNENAFTDLSGTVNANANANIDNPYDTLIDACTNDPAQIQLRYQTHREARNQQQKSKLLSPDFAGFMIDPVLEKLLDEKASPNYEDPRHCLVFWARPPQRIREIVGGVQKELQSCLPSLWLMPLDCLHMTVLEVAHSRTEAEIAHFRKPMEGKISDITAHTLDHRALLIRPMLSYDAAAIALSFIPAAGGSRLQDGALNDGTYTYHHLRRDIYARSKATGVEVASRYVVPSSHLTIARFVTQKDVAKGEGAGIDPFKMENLMKKLEELNGVLRREHWQEENGELQRSGAWEVGEEKGLVCRKGTLWYGGGESLHEGPGFSS